MNIFLLVYLIGILVAVLPTLRWDGAAWTRHISNKDKAMKRCTYSSQSLRDSWWTWHLFRYGLVLVLGSVVLVSLWPLSPFMYFGYIQFKQGAKHELSRQRLQGIVNEQQAELDRIKHKEGWDRLL